MSGYMGGPGQVIEYIQGSCFCFDSTCPGNVLGARQLVSSNMNSTRSGKLSDHLKSQIACTSLPTTPHLIQRLRSPSLSNKPNLPANDPREASPRRLAKSGTLYISPQTILYFITPSMQTSDLFILDICIALRSISTRFLASPQTKIARWCFTRRVIHEVVPTQHALSLAIWSSSSLGRHILPWPQSHRLIRRTCLLGMRGTVRQISL